MANSFPRGRFVWHELMTTDPDAAVAFYTKVVGWKTRGYEHDPSYRLWISSNSPRGGLMRLPEEARRMGTPPTWVPYIAVPNVDETVRRAEGLGARVYNPPETIPVGRFAVLGDPQGATFAVYTPATADMQGTDEPGVGDFTWHQLDASDWKKAWEFYGALFGWEHATSFEMGPDNTYWMFKRAGTTNEQMMGGMANRRPDVPAARWLCFAGVRDADAAAAAATSAGGKILSGPMDVPGGDRVATLMDPQGGIIAVHARGVRTRQEAPRETPVARRRKPSRKVKVKKAKPKKTLRPRAKRRPRARA
jgi:predicted enzyme related to lactoylglutathione lyase